MKPAFFRAGKRRGGREARPASVPSLAHKQDLNPFENAKSHLALFGAPYRELTPDMARARRTMAAQPRQILCGSAALEILAAKPLTLEHRPGSSVI